MKNALIFALALMAVSFGIKADWLEDSLRSRDAQITMLRSEVGALRHDTMDLETVITVQRSTILRLLDSLAVDPMKDVWTERADAAWLESVREGRKLESMLKGEALRQYYIHLEADARMVTAWKEAMKR
jgi:hypothetical protein